MTATMSASDAYYAGLLRSIAANRLRGEASRAAYAAGERRYWYFIGVDYCPVCGREDASRERVYGDRPERWEDRHDLQERYDWCEG